MQLNPFEAACGAPPPNFHLNPQDWEFDAISHLDYVTLYGKRDSADVIMVTNQWTLSSSKG